MRCYTYSNVGYFKLTWKPVQLERNTYHIYSGEHPALFKMPQCNWHSVGYDNECFSWCDQQNNLLVKLMCKSLSTPQARGPFKKFSEIHLDPDCDKTSPLNYNRNRFMTSEWNYKSCMGFLVSLKSPILLLVLQCLLWIIFSGKENAYIRSLKCNIRINWSLT